MTAVDPIRVVLVDDQELVRTGFRMIIESQPDLAVVGDASNGAAAVDLVGETPCDVVIMDVRMPEMDGVEATRRIIRQSVSPPKILILTTFDLDEYVFDGLQAGASGFLLKDTPSADLLHAVRTVATGDSVVGPTVTSRLITHYLGRSVPPDLAELREAALEPLTPRERDVLIELAQGRSNAEIGAALFLSEATVKTHVGHILTKLGLRDRVQAVVYAHQHHVLDADPGTTEG